MEIKKFQIQTTKEQHNLIKKSAQNEGLSISSYLRRLAILDSNKKELEVAQ